MRILKNKFLIILLALLLVWTLISLFAPQMLVWVNVTSVMEDGSIMYEVINFSAWPSNKSAAWNPDTTRLHRLTYEGKWEQVPAIYDEGFLFLDVGVPNRPVIKWTNTTAAKKPLIEGETYRLTLIMQKGNRTIEISDEFVA